MYGPLNYRFKIRPELPTAQLQTLGPFNVKMSCSPHKCSQSLVRTKVNSEMNRTTVMKFRCKFATFLRKQNNGKDIYLIRNSQEFVITCTARTMTKFYNNCKTNSKWIDPKKTICWFLSQGTQISLTEACSKYNVSTQFFDKAQDLCSVVGFRNTIKKIQTWTSMSYFVCQPLNEWMNLIHWMNEWEMHISLGSF